MTTAQTQWIETAIADASLRSWAKLIRDFEHGAREMLADWADDGLFQTEQQVRHQLCSWADSQIGQAGVANFNSSLGEDWQVTDLEGDVISTHATREQAEIAAAEEEAWFEQENPLAVKEGTRMHRNVRKAN